MKQANRSIPLSIGRESAVERLRLESAGEYSLPDYRPEVRRILTVDTRVLPSGSFRRGGRAEYAGVCVHTVLYATEDGSLASLETSTEYGFSFAAPESASVLVPPPTVEGVSCRLTGPRRLSVRASLVASPRVYVTEQYGEALGEMLAEEGVVSLSHPMVTTVPLLLSETGLGYHETILCEGALEPLLVRATPLVRESVALDDAVRVRGEVALSILAGGSARLPETVTHAIPFEVALPLDGESGEGEIFACAALTSLDVGHAPSDSGGTAFTVDLMLSVEAELLRKREVTPIVDLFSLKTPVKCLTETVHTSETVAVERHEKPVTVSISRAESDSEEALAVIDATALVHLVSEERRDGRLILTGDLRVDTALALGASDSEGRLGHSVSGFSRPIEISLPIPEGLGDASCDVEARVLSVSGRLEPQALTADARLLLTLRYRRSGAITVAVGAERGGEPYPPLPTGELVAVYPSESDSLWSLARRYRVTPERLAAENALSPAALLNADLPSSLDGKACLTVCYIGEPISDRQ